MLVTCTAEHSIGLAVVLVHTTLKTRESDLLRVHELNNIRTDGGREDGRQGNGRIHLISVLNGIDRNNRAGSLHTKRSIDSMSYHTCLE